MWSQGEAHDDVAAVDELQPGLDEKHVNDVHGVGKQVAVEPQEGAALSMAPEGRTRWDEPDVVAKGECHKAKPGDIPAVWVESGVCDGC